MFPAKTLIFGAMLVVMSVVVGLACARPGSVGLASTSCVADR